MGGQGKLRAQTRAEAKGAEMKISDEQEWAVNPTNINCVAPDRGLMGAGGIPSGTNPQQNGQQLH